MDTTRIHKIRNRQQARFLDHLKRTGQLTAGLESDVKRAYSFFEEDITKVVKGNDKETASAVAQHSDHRPTL
jgi:hypothetical protein